MENMTRTERVEIARKVLENVFAHCQAFIAVGNIDACADLTEGVSEVLWALEHDLPQD